jgi:hypothetical protein
MKPLTIPKPKRSAKDFLLKIVPALLGVCGVEAEQSFYGFKFNIENEARKRIYAMSEESAEKALDALKELLKEW